MRMIELFAGIGACSKALKNIGIDVEILDAVEIDKYAIKSFNAIHGTNFEIQDIKKWGKYFENVDLITHGSPCQDFSIAGNQAGGDIDSNTRSSLMYETIRIVRKIRPKYVLWENVKNILSERHKHNFDNYINAMETLGYNSYYQVLNAKDYGIPQNRERVYTVSIRKDIDIEYKFTKENICENNINRLYGLYGQNTRWGVYDKNGIAPTLTASMGMGGGHVPMIETFKFPKKQTLNLKLRDILEEEVDEKYYLKDYQIDNIKKSNFVQNQRRIQEKDCCDTLCARDWKDPKCIQVGNLNIKGHDCVKRVYNNKGISPTLTDMQGGNRQPKVLENDYKIRKLTPKECWRLMGFSDEDFKKAQSVPTSNTQLYKQAGNSIVVKVLEKIFMELLKEHK